MMDEANFHLFGYVISQNCRYWANKNPRDIHQKPLCPEKVIVRCGVASFGVIGPYFFEDEAGRAETVNSARYTEMLRTFLEPELQRLGVENQTLVSARRDNGSHCKDCNASPQQDVGSLHDLLNGLQNRPISMPVTSYSGNSSRARYTKRNQGQRWT
jgi:hypothetical protein